MVITEYNLIDAGYTKLEHPSAIYAYISICAAIKIGITEEPIINEGQNTLEELFKCVLIEQAIGGHLE